MKNKELDLYTDYLLSTFGAATATGFSKDLWLQVKSVVRSIERDEGVLIFDDTIQEKAWTDENELMCWHYDHVS
ncbi:IS701 family transposase, partial [Chitinimonas sp. BJB300]